MEFNLFKIRVHPKEQLTFDAFQGRSKPEILEDILRDHPKIVTRGRVWRIGAVHDIDDSSMYMQIGRTARKKKPLYTGEEFTKVDDEDDPFTHVVIDFNLEICAIAKAERLNTERVASQLIKLLSSTDKTTELNATLDIAIIPDPTDFIQYLEDAQRITYFWFTFKRPNPSDINPDIGKPLEETLADINGTSGRVSFSGANLEPDALKELTRSAAASATDAGATLLLPNEQEVTRKTVKENPAELSVEEEMVTERGKRKGLAGEIREWYDSIRGKNEREK